MKIAITRYEPGPSEIDLVDHANLISEAVKRDEVLAKAKVCVNLSLIWILEST